MLCRNSFESTLLARVLENSKCIYQVRYQNSKPLSKKGEKMKKIKVEEYLLFGKVVESKKQKVKRMKLEAEGKIQKFISSTTNSEFAWALSSATNKNTKIIKLFNEPVHNTNCDNQEIPKTEMPAESEISNGGPSKSEKKQELKKSSALLSRDIVLDLLNFPVFNECKSSDVTRSDKSKILSVSPSEDKFCLRYPSVTKILTATMSEEAKEILEKWKVKMIEKLGEEGFKHYHAELLGDGKLLHSTIMDKLTQKPYEVPEKIKNSFSSLEGVFKNVDNVQAVESHVIHSTLKYRGIVDCVAVYRNELCLIDWKKSDKVKESISSTYDAPLQLASYIGALNSDLKYPYQIKKGIIVVAYTSGEPAKVHEVSEAFLQMYWKLWLKRLQDYHVSLNPS